MKANKVKYCSNCCELTTHKFAGKGESGVEGLGLARVVFAVCTLGFSEYADSYYECKKCGKIS